MHWLKISEYMIHPNYNRIDTLKPKNIFSFIKILERQLSLALSRVDNEVVRKKHQEIEMIYLRIIDAKLHSMDCDTSMKDNVILRLTLDLLEHYEVLTFAYNKKRKYLYYQTVRYMLECIGTIQLLLRCDHKRINVYKAHRIILMKDLYDSKPFLLEYELKLNEIKKYYSYLYNDIELHYMKSIIKHTNGWALRLINQSNKPPKTIEIITFHIDNIGLKELVTNLYNKSCDFCHVSAYAFKEVQLFDNEIIIMNRLIKHLFMYFEIVENNHFVSVEKIHSLLNMKAIFDKIKLPRKSL